MPLAAIGKQYLRNLITILLLVCFHYGFNQTQIKKIDSLNYSYQLDSLKAEYSINKTILTKYELATYIALSYFPELKDAKIVFKSAKIKTTLNARPSIGSLLFRSKKNRKYVIRINNQIKDSLIDFRLIPFNAIIGLLGHEFSHIKDYSKKNIFQIIGRLLSYSSKKSKAKFEKEIDQLTIETGLGWQLYDWSKFVLEESNANMKYKKFKKEIYLTPAEISNFINKGL